MLKKIIFLLIIIALIPLYIIVRSSNNNNSLKEKVSQYIGQELFLPDSLKILYKDTLLPIKKSNLYSRTPKIVSVINGSCPSCISDVDRWQVEFINKTDTSKIKYLLYINTKNYSRFKNNIYWHISSSYPIIIDTSNIFIKKNSLIQNDPRFNTFLLDKNNQILLVGDPFTTQKMNELYLTTIKKLTE